MPAEGVAGISVRSLTKDFGELRAVDGLSFEVPMASITGFIGANGAGKTTTTRILLGLEAPTSGQALIAGHPLRVYPSPRRVVGAVLDSPGAHPGHTGRAHLEILARASQVPDARITEVLAMADLAGAARRKVGGYSLGMRQRLALAAALLGDPPVLILDEPTKGLDPPGIAWLRTFLRTLADAGRCLLVSSHHLTELEAIADRFVVLDHGRLAARGKLDELAASARTALPRPPAGRPELEDLLAQLTTPALSHGDDQEAPR